MLETVKRERYGASDCPQQLTPMASSDAMCTEVYATERDGREGRLEVFCCVACQHQFGLAEKGRRKVGSSLGVNCYSLLLHTSIWTVEDKTYASARKPADP